MDAVIKLIEPGEDPVEVFATMHSAGRNEFAAAGQNGFHAAYVFEVWAAEYDDQAEVEYNGKRLSIYRTFGPRPDDKLELYTEERVGKRVDKS